ncbi:hypothetical protein PS943_00843 [Pseudomonas fluorescens]|uniref:Uncharacterized protein n=1 Tax=Pseudomonas fluorescens TaxID=294 RepID=A0A5E7W0H6_PSEFL|nr:hypothetical protein [Pseudomonas fluorescens]VVQ28370.1 hypothetical protein PS943_00843 [Pseudomonas fluorescens]
MNLSNPGSLLACLAFAVMTPFAHSAATTVSPMNMVFTSDPQYPWTEKTDAGETQTDSYRDSRSKWLIETQYNDIASFDIHGLRKPMPVKPRPTRIGIRALSG